MSRLHLVRHAQASFGLENYDQLSELGIRQSSYIPSHFETGAPVQAYYRGDMKRHKQTIEHGFPGIEVTEITGLNEFDHENVLRVHMPQIADREAAVALVMSQPDPMKFIESEFEKAMQKWMEEEGTSSYKESFKHFKQRCIDALHTIVSKARNEKQKEVIAVTSGGFISLVVAHILHMPDSRMTDLNLNIANASVTSLLFNDDKISLGYFNNYSHLPKDMVTFR
jgi:broad specificity phosphatase PhoE